MAAAGVSRSGPTSEALDDYSPYSHLNDDELLQLAIQRSLTDTHNTGVPAGGQESRRADSSNVTPTQQQQQPRHSSRNAPPETDARLHNAPAEYSSPNPPAEKPPDPYVHAHFVLAANCWHKGHDIRCVLIEMLEVCRKLHQFVLKLTEAYVLC